LVNKPQPTGTNPTDVAVVATICFGWFVVSSVDAVAAGFPTSPFTDASFIELAVLEFVLGGAAVAYLRARGYDLAQLVPVPNATGSLIGLALYVAAAFAAWLLVMPFGAPHSGTQPIEQMAGNATISWLPLVGVSSVNGLYEEVFLIGYLQRALEASGAVFAISVSVLVRMLYHLYQGPVGALSVVAFGLVLSLYFLRTRNLWPIVFAHIFTDIVGFSLV
jgi:membrane protease YdiL (CAAX protease family)